MMLSTAEECQTVRQDIGYLGNESRGMPRVRPVVEMKRIQYKTGRQKGLVVTVNAEFAAAEVARNAADLLERQAGEEG